MSLDTLPNELKRLILQAAPDVATLSTLVHSSPSYHAVYLTFRTKCLTEITLRELENRNIDVLTPMSFVEVCTRGNQSPDYTLGLTIERCYRQTQKNQSIRLSARRCRALLTLKDLIGWYVERKNGLDTIRCSRTVNPCAIQAGKPGRNQLYIDLDRSTYKDNYLYELANYHFITFDSVAFPRMRPFPAWSMTTRLGLDPDIFSLRRFMICLEAFPPEGPAVRAVIR